MKRIALHEMKKEDVLKIIKDYTAPSRLQSDIDVRIYIDYRFNGYSSNELAEREQMNRVTVYRRVKKVDQYIRETHERLLGNTVL